MRKLILSYFDMPALMYDQSPPSTFLGYPTPSAPGVELIFAESDRQTRSCHAGTLLLLRDGSVLAAWFGPWTVNSMTISSCDRSVSKGRSEE